jgi:hypothetical protein
MTTLVLTIFHYYLSLCYWLDHASTLALLPRQPCFGSEHTAGLSSGNCTALTGQLACRERVVKRADLPQSEHCFRTPHTAFPILLVRVGVNIGIHPQSVTMLHHDRSIYIIPRRRCVESGVATGSASTTPLSVPFLPTRLIRIPRHHTSVFYHGRKRAAESVKFRATAFERPKMS